MAASTQIKSPFLAGAPVSFERLDSPDSANPTSPMQSTVSSQEMNSWWNNYLAPTTGSTSPEVNVVSKPLETSIFSQPEMVTKVETKESKFNMKGEIVFNPKETVLAQAVIAEGSIDVKSEQTVSVNDSGKFSTSVAGVLEKIDLSGGVEIAKKTKTASKDVKVAIWDLFKNYIMVKPEKKDAQKKEEKKKAPAPFNLRPGMSEDRKQQIQKQAEDINRRLKTRNTSYEGVLNPDGSIRADIQTLLDKTNSELAEADLKKKKESQMAALKGSGKKGGKGPRVSTNLDLAPETQNAASKLLG